MFAKEYRCTVTSVRWVSLSVVVIHFVPHKRFNYRPGQFISIEIPSPDPKARSVKRCYSLAGPPEQAPEIGYELCVRFIPGGKGSTFVSSLSPGDVFMARAAFGDFTYRPPKPNRSVCFICTGTGIGPIRSILQSQDFQSNKPHHAILICGGREERDLIYHSELNKLNIELVNVLSNPSDLWRGITGRVTDVLRQLPSDWAWHGTDFYICGNPDMVRDVNSILQLGHGISHQSIIKEAFELSSKGSSSNKAPQSIKKLIAA